MPVLCAVALLAGCSGKKDPKPAVPKPVTEAPKVVVDGDQLQFRGDLTYFEGKPLTGVALSRFNTGRKWMEATYKDGMADGLLTWWYENGQKREESTFKDGKCVTGTAWKQNGEKCPDTNVVNGNGPAYIYYKNGQKESEFTYKDGKIISNKFWDEDGNLTSEYP